ncbi:hypothetical protein TNCV_2705041 [Trichonephila clavipes]|nr:hypothetical protein TNCV_2705041 [Trichonephila clavipes]
MTPKWSPNWSPKMMPTWLYRQDFAKFSLNRHYNAAWHHLIQGPVPARGPGVADHCSRGLGYAIRTETYAVPQDDHGSFELMSSVQDDIESGESSLNYHSTPTGGP